RNHVFGPFLYRNLFALYVNLCIGLALGLLFASLNRTSARRSSRKRSSRRSDDADDSDSVSLLSRPVVLWVSFAVALMVCGVTLSQSRGGLVVLVAAAMACAVIR